MSPCGRTNHLEAMVAGELGEGPGRDLRAHAATCSRCRHELNWLESERSLFRQRASRDEVSALWKGVEQRSGLRASSGRAWRGVFSALAATVVVLVGVGQLARLNAQPAPSQVELSGGVSDWSEGGYSSLQPYQVCSTVPEGLGFHCGPAVPASFLASR